jgi:hypothetical protein
MDEHPVLTNIVNLLEKKFGLIIHSNLLLHVLNLSHIDSSPLDLIKIRI